MALMASFLIACFISSLWFTLKYKKYSKKYALDFNPRTQRFMLSAFTRLIIAVTALFSV
jgi:hypothetical protein